MSNSTSDSRTQDNATSARIALAAGLISSTLFLVAASLVSVGCLIASTQSMGAIKEGTDDSIRVTFWGFLSLMNVIVFYFFGTSGMITTMRGYKEFDRRSQQSAQLHNER